MLCKCIGHSHATAEVGKSSVLATKLAHFVAALTDCLAGRTRPDLLVVVLI